MKGSTHQESPPERRLRRSTVRPKTGSKRRKTESSDASEASASEGTTSTASSSHHSSRSSSQSPLHVDEGSEDGDKTLSPRVLGFSHAQQQQSAVLTRLRLSRAHQLRRLLSQRHIAAPEPVVTGKSAPGRPGGHSLLERAQCLPDSDAALLMTFSNSSLFEKLISAVGHGRDARAEAPPLEHALTSANPLFGFSYTKPPPSTLPTPATGSSFGVASMAFTALDDCRERWRHDVVPVERRATQQESTAAPLSTGASTADRRSHPVDDKGVKPSAASGSLVARSMQSWATHLAEELGAEGETVENYRHSKSRNSYLDKVQFQQEAQWNEFLRERRLQEAQRELAAKRGNPSK